jgi:DNA modification methylase
MMPDLNRIYHGDAKAVLSTWPDSFVDLCLTSPPYWKVKDYGVPNQLGQEETPEAYIDSLVDTLMEVGRVLKPSGSLYLNLGDTYRARSLLALPWRVAIRLINSGYLLRNDIVWAKRNSLPTSTTTRFRNSHEYVFFLVKQPGYYFNLDAVREPHQTKTKTLQVEQRPHGSSRKIRGGGFPGHMNGKNPADVFSLHTENRPKKYIVPGYDFEGHFAPFPESLCEKPILASCPPGGIVLDPFMGSGTTAVVARRLGRQFLGIDLSAEYVKLAEARLRVTDPSFDRSIHQGYNRVTPSRVQEGSSGELSFSPWDQEAA